MGLPLPVSDSLRGLGGAHHTEFGGLYRMRNRQAISIARLQLTHGQYQSGLRSYLGICQKLDLSRNHIVHRADNRNPTLLDKAIERPALPTHTLNDP